MQYQLSQPSSRPLPERAAALGRTGCCACAPAPYRALALVPCHESWFDCQHSRKHPTERTGGAARGAGSAEGVGAQERGGGTTAPRP